MGPLLSIIIPTKDRYRTLGNLVGKLMTWDSHDFEVIIQDNTTNNEPFTSFLDQYKNDTRLKYFHVGTEALSVTDNTTLAIEHSSGEFVCFLGDDDGIIAQSLDLVNWMKVNNVDSLNCVHGAYCWPEYRFKNSGKKKSLAGMLLYRNYSGAIRQVSPLEALDELLEDGALRINDITRMYHGIVSRTLIHKLKDKAGTYFPGPVADMSSAVGLSFFSQKHMVIDYPLIIAGASGTSFAGKSGQRKSHGKIEDQAFLPKDTIKNWSKCLPQYLTAQTIWPESAIQALRKTGNEHLISKLNIPKIYAEYLVDFPELAMHFEEFLKETYSTSEILDLKRNIKKYRSKYKINKLKYWIKVYAVYFNVHNLIKLRRIDADDIATALTTLENETNLNFKNKNDSFLSEVLK